VALDDPPGGLEPQLAQHPARSRIVDEVPRHQPPVPQRVRDPQHRARRLGGIAAAPLIARDPVANLGLALMLAQPGAADHPGAGQRDQKVRQAVILRQGGKVARLALAIGPGRARKIADHGLIRADRGMDRLPILRKGRSQEQSVSAMEHEFSLPRPAPASKAHA
jgi:hypothetical protein